MVSAVAVRGLGLQALLASLLAAARRLVVRPVWVLLVLHTVGELRRRWAARRRFLLGFERVRNITDEVDAEIIQGCLLSTENLLNLGRVEKRTLFQRPLLELLGGNAYLVREILAAAQVCRASSHNCVVMRWLPPDERYHVLQSCLNVVSSLFGANYVHFNALDGESSGLFKSTWYCITVTTPTRPETGSRPHVASQVTPDNTCTFTDMSRTPRATLRVTVVNESELRRIADDKLKPPSWGFFNTRHAERYRMLEDIARNFRLQLVRTPADSRGTNTRSPFTSEKAHSRVSKLDKPDGGFMKRVQSQPHLAQSKDQTSQMGSLGTGRLSAAVGGGRNDSQTDIRHNTKKRHSKSSANETSASGRVADEDNCFLRLHVPHYLGPTGASNPHTSANATGGCSGQIGGGSARTLGRTGSLSMLGGDGQTRLSGGGNSHDF